MIWPSIVVKRYQHIVQCSGLLAQFWPPIVHVTPLKTPFGLVIPLLQSQSQVTTITIISYAITRLHNNNPYTFVTTITYSTLARLHSLPTLHSNLHCTIAHKVSYLTQYVFITHIHTSNKHSVLTLRNCFLPRTYCLALTSKTDFFTVTPGSAS
jgi:hypothetical protein